MNINEIIDDIKKKEFIHELQNRESLEILAHTSLLQEHNAKLADEISHKEDVLQNLMLQIAAKTQEVKLKRASVKFVKEAQEYLKKKEDEQLTDQCKFYEEQWNASKKIITAIYDQVVEHQRSEKVAQQQINIFQVGSFQWDEAPSSKKVNTQNSVACISFEDFDGDVNMSPEQNFEDKDKKKQVFETSCRDPQSQNSFVWDTEEEIIVYESRNNSNGVNCRSYTLNSGAHTQERGYNKTVKRPDQRLPNQRPSGGVIPNQQKTHLKAGVVLSERLKPRDASSYSQKPMTSSWVTSSFGATSTEVDQSASAFRPSKIAPREQKFEFADEPAWEHDLSDFDDFDEEWTFRNENQTSAGNKAAQKKPNTFQPKKSLLK